MTRAPYEQPLDPSLRQIRLLEILPEPHDDGRLQCYLSIASIYDVESNYQALSYTWGKPDDFNFMIWMNCILIPVRRNLLCALRALRADYSTVGLPIWIDALCIDQSNIKERGHQVLMMGHIYRNAQQVISWLGTTDELELGDEALDVRRSDPPEISVVAFDFITRAVDSGLSRDLHACNIFLVDDSAGERLHDVLEIFSVEYWERLWVLQEVCLARRLLLRRGRMSMEWSSVREFGKAAESFIRYCRYTRKGGLQKIIEITRSRPWQLDEIMQSNDSLADDESAWFGSGIYDLIKVSSHCLCADRRDKIYGLLGLATDVGNLGLSVDYTLSLFQLYVKMMKTATKNELGGKEVAFSQTLQRSLLGPDFGKSGFDEMRIGRTAMLTDSTIIQKRWSVSGTFQGTITGTSSTLSGLLQWISHALDDKTTVFSLYKDTGHKDLGDKILKS